MSRRAWPERTLLLLALVAAVGAAALAAGCGGSTSSGVAPFRGVWERVDGGQPDPDFTLTIGDGAVGVDVTFANQTNGMSRTTGGMVEDDTIACMLPAEDSVAVGVPSASGVPSESDLRLSIDDATGQLVVDLVLADGTLQPVWLYERLGATSLPPSPSSL